MMWKYPFQITGRVDIAYRISNNLQSPDRCPSVPMLVITSLRQVLDENIAGRRCRKLLNTLGVVEDEIGFRCKLALVVLGTF